MLLKKIYLDKKDSAYKLKLGIWVYFFLLIFEGALRKWILPGLSTPLLIIRDPVALYLIIMAIKKRMFPVNIYTPAMVVVGAVSIFTAILFGHGNIVVAIYGARILLLHFPVIFIIGNVFSRADVIKVGKATLWIAIPMTILISLQFYSPQSAWVNRGVGGDESGGGFSGAAGFFRPPGTFSFTNGTTAFYSFLAPFVLYFWLYPQYIKRWILVAATVSMLASIPLSISRALFFSVIVTVIFTFIAVSRKPTYLKRVITATIGVIFAVLVLSQLSFFQTSINAFTMRFEGANESEGGLQSVLLDRYLGGMVGALTSSANFPFWGYGLGLGTNIGVQLVHGQFPIAEGEWGRVIQEQGLILGISVVLIRVGMSIKYFIYSYQRLLISDLFPWILLSNFLLNVPQAQWKQPTSLGFSVMIAGLLIASFNSSPKSAIKKN